MTTPFYTPRPAGANWPARVITPLIAATLVAFFSWAAWAEIDQITRVEGTVVPSSRNQIIQPMERGRIHQIHVREGEFVNAGDLLVTLDQERAQAAYRETRVKYAAEAAAIARLTAELTGEPPHFPEWLGEFPEILTAHETLLERRRASYEAEIEGLQETIDLIEQELELTEPLMVAGDVSQVDILRLQRERTETRSQLINRQRQYVEEVQSQLLEAREAFDALSQLLIQHRQAVAYTEINAPTRGVVRDIRVTTRGGVVSPGEEIMQIVPTDDDYIVDARVRPQDIAHVRPGLDANIKLAAYDFMIYGSFPGTVEHISADTVEEEERQRQDEEPRYRVYISVQGKDLQGTGPEPVVLQPGMTATVEIETGDNTVLGFLTKPITRGISESLGER